jgi:hypothetical protein
LVQNKKCIRNFFGIGLGWMQQNKRLWQRYDDSINMDFRETGCATALGLCPMMMNLLILVFLALLTFSALLQATGPRKIDCAIGRAQLVFTLPSFNLYRLTIWPSWSAM